MSSKKEVLKQMLLRTPLFKPNNLHAKSRKIQNQMTQAPQPLKYKLQEYPEDFVRTQPLGNTQELPFHVGRAYTGNLPVYTKYTHGRNKKRTVIRHVQGDIDSFTRELSKIVSNAEIIPKVGKIEIKGLHTHVVSTWLQRLGF